MCERARGRCSPRTGQDGAGDWRPSSEDSLGVCDTCRREMGWCVGRGAVVFLQEGHTHGSFGC